MGSGGGLGPICVGRQTLRLPNPGDLAPVVVTPESTIKAYGVKITMPAFTLLCDPFSPIATGRGQTRQAMQAHLVLTAILFGELRLTDTQCLTSGNLADLLLSDSVSRELLSRGTFQIALRDQMFGGGQFDGLQSLVGTFGSNAFNPEYAETFGRCAKMLEKQATFIGWTMDEVSRYYTENTLHLLEREAERLGYHETELHTALLRFLSQKIQESGGFLKRDHLRLAAPEFLKSENFVIDKHYIHLLENVSSSYYFSAIPSSIGASTIYESGHKEILKLRDGMVFDFAAVSEVVDIASPVDLRFLTEGICLLDVDDVLGLIACKEAAAYRRAMSALSNEETGGTISEVRTSLIELQYKIDEAILEKDGRFRFKESHNNVRQARTLIDIATGATTLTLSLAAELLLTKGLPGLGLIIGLPAKKFRNIKYGDERLSAHIAARHQTRKMAYTDRMRQIGRGQSIHLSVPPDAARILVEVQNPSFVAS